VPPYAYAKEFLPFETRPAEGNDATILKDVNKLRPEVDCLIVSVHWGVEYEPRPDARQRQLGRLLIDNGVDVVAGHHPHVLQEPEWYEDGVIIYSMGNFVFDQHTRPATRKSRLYEVTLTPEGVGGVKFLPIDITLDWQPVPHGQEWFTPRKGSRCRQAPGQEGIPASPL
jgi:poly-gamma-glutamate synthesis protein (capsule biosynthesis protein)